MFGSFWGISVVLLSCIVANTGSSQETSRLLEDESEPAKAGDAPFAVVLWSTEAVPAGSMWCTGSIIDESWVLTAAHCLDMDFLRHLVLKTIYTALVIAGATSRSEFAPYGGVQPYWAQAIRSQGMYDDPTGYQVRRIKKAIKHPYYDMNLGSLKGGLHDIGLVKVNPWKWTTRVGKVELWSERWPSAPSKSGDWAVYEVLNCSAYGWGTFTPAQDEEHVVDSKEKSVEKRTHLRKGKVPAQLGDQACDCLPPVRTTELICQKGDSSSMICPGDSGGPLVYEGKVVGTAHMIVNFLSCDPNNFVPVTAKCGDNFMVGMWTFVCPNLHFIRKHVLSIPACAYSGAVRYWGMLATVLLLYYLAGLCLLY